jgi:hypothetical protein
MSVRVMFTPCGRGVTHTYHTLLARAMFTPCGRGVAHIFNEIMTLCSFFSVISFEVVTVFHFILVNQSTRFCIRAI